MGMLLNSNNACSSLSHFLCLLLVQKTYQDSTTCNSCVGNLECPAENQGVTMAPFYTSSAGQPIGDLTASLSAGPRGPLLLQDSTLIDILANFDHERIPERVVHAKGAVNIMAAGAFGYFVVTRPELARFCKAGLFSEVGKKTDIAVRFSCVTGESGTADTNRDPRGFAVKFYTDEGNWDLVGNNSPIFFMRDPILFPAFIHTQKRNPQTHLKDANMFWDFITLQPQTVHQVMITFSDRGIPDGYRFMHGYGSHTFKLVNSTGHAVYCKFHYRSDQGIRNLDPVNAATLRANDPDYAIKDLFNAIAKGDFPSWTLFVQIMTYQQAESFRWNPFDLTKVWPQPEFPLVEVGRLVLNRNPTNYFAEVEQVAFSPSNMVPGIGPSPDKMLQARMFSYSDTQRYRLGSNYQQLPVNCPSKVIVNNFNQDGSMRFGDNNGAAPNYYPNSYNGGKLNPQETNEPYSVTGDVQRYHTDDDDNFSQPKRFWIKVLKEPQRKSLVENIIAHLINAEAFIQDRAVKMFSQVDVEFGQRLAEGLQRTNSSNYYTCTVKNHVLK